MVDYYKGIIKIINRITKRGYNFNSDIFIIIVFILLVLTTLVSCTRNSDMDDTKNFIMQVRKQEKKEVEPLPYRVSKPDTSYLGKNKRSPFVTSDDYVKNQMANSKYVDKPDINREKELLESFKLENLKMVGSLKSSDGSIAALIMDTNGRVHTVQKGNYIGQKFGKIIKIDEKEIEVNEIIPGSFGKWLEKTVIIDLKQ